MIHLGDFAIAVEVLIEIGFAVVVKVMQAHDAIAAGNVDHLVDDLQAERLE